jgi:hypothetical protein
MKEKMTIALGIGITTLVVFTFAYYIFANPTIELFDLISIPIILIIILTSSYIIYDKWKNIKAGLPSKDERLKLAAYKAGYYGFIAAIWGALLTNFGYNIIFDQDLRGGLVVAAVVLISGTVFMISYLYFARKGD